MNGSVRHTGHYLLKIEQDLQVRVPHFLHAIGVFTINKHIEHLKCLLYSRNSTSFIGLIMLSARYTIFLTDFSICNF